jgi:hypothetical protein
MGRKCLGPAAEALEDEVDILRRQAFYALLNYVVRELVANTLEHFAAELFGHHKLLIVFPYIKSLKQRQQIEQKPSE